MTLNTPTHPGEHILHDCLEPLGLTIAEGAQELGVSEWKLSEIIEGRARVTPEFATRLEKTLGSSARSWYLLQVYCELGMAETNAAEFKIERCISRKYGKLCDDS